VTLFFCLSLWGPLPIGSNPNVKAVINLTTCAQPGSIAGYGTTTSHFNSCAWVFFYADLMAGRTICRNRKEANYAPLKQEPALPPITGRVNFVSTGGHTRRWMQPGTDSRSLVCPTEPRATSALDRRRGKAGQFNLGGSMKGKQCRAGHARRCRKNSRTEPTTRDASRSSDRPAQFNFGNN
jgi:hypothetical protein